MTEMYTFMNNQIEYSFMSKLSDLENFMKVPGQSEVDAVFNSIRQIKGKEVVEFRSKVAVFFDISPKPMKTPRLTADDEDEYGDLTDTLVLTTRRIFPVDPGKITHDQFKSWGTEIVENIRLNYSYY